MQANLIELSMYQISQLFLIPTLVLIAALFLYAFWVLGEFALLAFYRRRGKGRLLVSHFCRESTLSADALDVIAHKQLENPRIASRVTPMLGLVATMIPMGPALKALAVTGVLTLAWWLPRWARAPHAWADGSGLTAKLAKVRDAFAESTRHARFGWLWTIANWTVKLAAQAGLLSALIPAAVNVGAAGALGAELAAILPVQGVAGFGTYEAGAAAAMLPSGVALAAGLQVALALHLFVIACSVTSGAIAWLFPAASALETTGTAPSDIQSASSDADGAPTRSSAE